MDAPQPAPATSVSVEHVTELNRLDLDDLCDATDAAIVDGNGFGWLHPQPRDQMERYWKGVLLVPERLDGSVAASAQLQLPPRFNEAQAHCPQLTTHFVAPWARGHGLAAGLLEAVEEYCGQHGYTHLRLDVRCTQARAIEVYEDHGFTRWGELPSYAEIDGKLVTGYFYVKDLSVG